MVVNANKKRINHARLMKHYPKEGKDAVIAKMANHPSLPELAKQEGISLPTLYAWRRKAHEQGILMPSGDDTPDGWSSAARRRTALTRLARNHDTQRSTRRPPESGSVPKLSSRNRSDGVSAGKFRPDRPLAR